MDKFFGLFFNQLVIDLWVFDCACLILIAWKTRKSCFSYRTGFHCYTVILFYYHYLKLIQLYCCFYKVFTAPLKFFSVSLMFLLHFCSYEVSTASLKLRLFQQCSHCIAVHTTLQSYCQYDELSKWDVGVHLILKMSK